MSSKHNKAKSLPIPRRKSCNECVKGKRRCDQRLPSCTRCSRLKLSCHYVPRPDHNSAAPAVPACSFGSVSLGNQNEPHSLEWSLLSPIQVLLETETEPEPEPEPELAGFSIDENDPLSSFGMPDDFDELIQTVEVPAPALTEWQAPQLAMTKLPSPYPPSVIAERLDYPMEQFKLAPSQLVLDNRTPWSHPLLYHDHMPRAMEDAYATCALHMSKNTTNTAFITRHVENRMNDLLATPIPTDPLEILARTQSLLLYQIIQFLDNDISPHIEVDTALTHLKHCGRSLSKHIHEEIDISSSIALYPIGVVRTSWKSWIFRESARRTLLMCFLFISVCYVLKRNKTHCSDYEHEGIASAVTVSAHLWSASSAFDFTVAWREKNHFEIQDIDFSEVLTNAVPDDIDVFTKILLVALLGIDNVRGWLYVRGGRL